MAQGLYVPSYLKQTDLQKSAEKFSASGRSIGVKAHLDFGNVSKFHSPLGKITGQVDDFTKSMEAANARVTAFAGTAAVLATVSGAIRGVVTNTILLEKRLTDLQIVFGSNAKETERFGRSLFDVAKKTGQSFEAVFEAATEFSRQGLGVAETLKRTQDALTITRLTGIDTANAVKGLTAAFEAYGDTVKDTTEIIDKFSAVDTKFAVSTSDFVQAFQRSASVAREAGVSFEQLTALVTAVQERTQRGGANIGNALKSIITVLRTDKALLDDISKTYNIDVEFDDGSLVDAYTILEKLGQKLKDMPNDVAKANLTKRIAGGRYQVNTVSALLQDFGAGKEGNAAKALIAQGDAAGTAAEKMAKVNLTLADMINKLQASSQEFAGTFGKFAFGDEAKSVINFINNGLERMNELLDPDNTDTTAKAFRSVAKAIGSVVSGPGLALFVAIFAKLFKDFAVFGVNSAATFLKINQKASETRAIEENILTALSRNEGFRVRILSLQGNELAQKREMLQLYAQEAQYQKMISGVASTQAKNIYSSGFRATAGGVTQKYPTFAIPTNLSGMLKNANQLPATAVFNKGDSAIDDAIQRERNAGLPMSRIRINTDKRLRASDNPLGIAVTNTRDEPFGKIPNFAAYYDPEDKTVGYRQDRIPKGQQGAGQLLPFPSKDIKDVAINKFSKEIESAVQELGKMRMTLTVLNTMGAMIPKTFSDVQIASKGLGNYQVKSPDKLPSFLPKGYMSGKDTSMFSLEDINAQEILERGKAANREKLGDRIKRLTPFAKGETRSFTLPTDKDNSRTDRILQRMEQVISNTSKAFGTGYSFGPEISKTGNVSAAGFTPLTKRERQRERFGRTFNTQVGLMYADSKYAAPSVSSANILDLTASQPAFSSAYTRNAKRAPSGITSPSFVDVGSVGGVEWNRMRSIYSGQIGEQAKTGKSIEGLSVRTAANQTNPTEMFAKLFVMQTALSAVTGALEGFTDSTNQLTTKIVDAIGTIGISIIGIKQLGSFGGVDSESLGRLSALSGRASRAGGGDVGAIGKMASFSDRGFLDRAVAGYSFGSSRAAALKAGKKDLGDFDVSSLGGIGKFTAKIGSSLGGLGSGVIKVGGAFTRFLPVIGQLGLAITAISSIFSVFGIDLKTKFLEAIGWIKTPAQEAAESLKKFSESVNEQTAQGIFAPMSEVFTRIKSELDRFTAIGKAKTDEERERLQGMTPEQFRTEQNKKDFQELSDSIVNKFSRYNEKVTEYYGNMNGGGSFTYTKVSDKLDEETKAAFGAFVTNLLNANFWNADEVKKGLASNNPNEVAKARGLQGKNVENLLNYGDFNGQDIMSLASQSLSKNSFDTFARNFADKTGSFNLKGDIADLSKEKLNLLATGLAEIFKVQDIQRLYKQKKNFYEEFRKLMDPTELKARNLEKEDFESRMKSLGMGEDYFQSPELSGRIAKNQAISEFQSKLKTDNGESITGDQIDYLFSEMKKYSDPSNLVTAMARGEGGNGLSPDSVSAFIDLVNKLPKIISDAESKQNTENARRQTEEYQGLLGSARNRINPNFKAERAYSEAFNSYTSDERAGFIKKRQNQELSTSDDDAKAAAEEFFALLADDGTISLTNARKASESLFKEFADSVKTSNQAAAALDAWNKASQENKQIFFEELQASKVASAQLSYRQAKENPYSTRQGIENARIAVNQAEGSGAGSFSQGAKSFVYDLEESQKDFAYNLGKKIPEDFASGMARAFDAMLMETDNLGEALRSIALDFLGTIRQAFLQQAASNIVGSVVSGFASGGYINRGSGTKDDVPALLMKGEYVVNKNSVDKYGKGFFEHLNAGKIQKFATGGIAMPSAGGGGSIVGSSNLLGFATQQYTSGKDDIIAATRAGTSIALEDESRRLSFAALSGQTGSVRTSEVQRAKEQAIDLVMADSEARAAAKKADKEGNKQLLRSLLVTAASAGMAYGATQYQGFGSASANNASTNQFQNYRIGVPPAGTQYANSGGIILRGDRLRDGVPAVLTGNEYVMNNRAVSKYGKGFMDRVNSQRLNDGTPITNSAPNQVTTNGNTIVNITVNSENSNVTSDATSSDGKTDRRKEEELAQKIKQVVLRTITEEKRVSGSLRK